jgi:hypothetical protein
MGRLLRRNNITIENCDDINNLIRSIIPPQKKLFVGAPLFILDNNIKIESMDGASRRVQATANGTIFVVPEGRAAVKGCLAGEEGLGEKEQMRFFKEISGK